MNYVKYSRGFLCAAILISSTFSVSAQESEGDTYSWNVAAVSDYVARSLSQTNEKPTVQAGFSYISQSGFYAGFWNSGLKWVEGGPNLEFDLFMGYGFSVTDRLWVDAMLVYYTYHGQDGILEGIDYGDFFVTTTFDGKYKLTTTYTNNYLNYGLEAEYLSLARDWNLPQDFLLSTSIGRNFFQEGAGVPDYTDWGISIGRKIGPFGINLGYYGVAGQAQRGNPLASNRVVLSVSIGQ